MGMGKNMILTVLIIPGALGAEPKLQLRIGFVRPPADSAFVPCAPCRLFHFPAELLPALRLLRRHMDLSPAGDKKYDKVHQGRGNDNLIRNRPRKELEYKKGPVNNPQYPDFDGNHEKQHYLHIGVSAGKGQENGHIHIKGAEHGRQIRKCSKAAPQNPQLCRRLRTFLENQRLGEQQKRPEYGEQNS